MSTVTLLDGGMGKELRRIGAPFRQPEWSAMALMEAPETVIEAHRNFIDAGAEVIITNNYAVVPYHLGEGVIAERGHNLVALAGRLARQAANDVAEETGRTIRVAGSLPPLFGSYEPDRFDRARAPAYYRDIVAALDPYVDLWIGETLSLIDEMVIITEAIRACGSGQPVWMAFTLPDEWDGAIALRSGDTPDDIADAVATTVPEVEAVLFNCSLPEQTGPALARLSSALTGRGLTARTGAYANAFPTTRSESYQANEVIFERRADLTPERYAEIVAEWIEAGATIVGGCCDMYPDHIRALADLIAA